MAINAEVVTELTEPFDANASAIAGSTGDVKEMTITTQARIYPTDGASQTICANNATGAAARGSMSQQRLRAHVILQL